MSPALAAMVPLPRPTRPRAYPENATTDELRARLIALGRGLAALVEEDADLTPPTVEACQHHAKDALRILLCLRVDQRPQEDFGGPMTIPFSGRAADNRTAFQVALDAIDAEAERQAARVRP